MKNIYKIMIWTLTFVFIFNMSGCKNKEKNNNLVDKNTILTKKQIIEIANKEAISRGKKVNVWTKILYDVDNKQWKQTYTNIKREDKRRFGILRYGSSRP